MSPEEQNGSKIHSSESVKIHLHYLDHFFRVEQNEELQSEQRIKFFLTLTTGIIAFLVVLFKFNINDDIPFKIIAVFLLVLFLLGLFVFARVIWSDRKIKQQRQLWSISYEAIKIIDPSVVRYKERQNEMDDQKIFSPLRKFKGTLTQIVWFIEGILIASFMFVLGIILDYQLTSRIILTCITLVCVLIVLWRWAKYIKKGISKNENNEINNSA